MRVVSLVLVALLLASMSHQDLITFGEFVGGSHEESPKGFRIFSTTYPDFKDKDYLENDIRLISLNSKQFTYEDYCNTATYTMDAQPQITKKSCPANKGALGDAIVGGLSTLSRYWPGSKIFVLPIGDTFKVPTSKGEFVFKRRS